jgi:hypothetical protein
VALGEIFFKRWHFGNIGFKVWHLDQKAKNLQGNIHELYKAQDKRSVVEI